MKAPALHLVGMSRAADWAGMSHAGLETSLVGSIAVVLSARIGLDALGHHHQVLAACRRGPFLPARAGQVWNQDAEAAIAPEAFQSSVMAQLDLVEGCVELTLQMSLAAPGEVAFVSGKGASYLRQRQSELAAGAEVEARLSRAAELITRSVRFRTRCIHQHITPNSDSVGLLMAFLVERQAGQRLASDIEALAAAALPDGMMRVDGPWPPYHFAAPAAAASSEARAA
jgi:hypothetical protein